MSFLKYHLPLIVYAGLIFYFSSIPDLTRQLPDYNLNDKLMHFVEFGIFGMLIWRSACRWKLIISRRWLIILVGIIGVVYAAGDEFHQSFVPGRYAHVLDWTADSLGLAIGIILAIFIAKNGRKSDDKT